MADELEQLPRVVALAWGMLEHPQRGPKRELTHERIVEAATEIADTEGLAAVTMSRVATSLGFTTMSLYRYVTSKDELLQLMSDNASLVVPPPAPDEGDWRAELRQWALLVRGLYADHPWFIEIPVSYVQLLMPNNMMMVDLALRSMRTLRVREEEKIAILMVLSSFVRSFSTIERDLTGLPSQVESGEIRAAVLGMREIVTAERFPDLYPLIQHDLYLSDVAEMPSEAISVDDFEFGLARLLDGFALYQDEHGTDEPSEPAPSEDSPLVDEAIRKDKGVREAGRARREAEVKLREAIRKEREMIKKAQEKAKKAAARAEAAEAKRAAS